MSEQGTESGEAVERLRRLMRLVLTDRPRGDHDTAAPRRWRRHDPAEIAAAVTAPGRAQPDIPPDMDRAHLEELLTRVRAGATATIPAALLGPLARFFGVPSTYLTDPDVAELTDRGLLQTALDRLQVNSMWICRGPLPTPHHAHTLLGALLDPILEHQ